MSNFNELITRCPLTTHRNVAVFPISVTVARVTPWWVLWYIIQGDSAKVRVPSRFSIHKVIWTVSVQADTAETYGTPHLAFISLCCHMYLTLIQMPLSKNVAICVAKVKRNTKQCYSNCFNITLPRRGGPNISKTVNAIKKSRFEFVEESFEVYLQKRMGDLSLN